MPNKFGGNKFKKGKKRPKTQSNEPIPFADEITGCYYGQIIKKIGTGFYVMINGKQETATICGKMRNRQWCNPGDVVMVNLDLDKYIITHKYNADAIKQLKTLGKINFGNSNDNDSTIFEDDEDDDVFDMMDSLKKTDGKNQEQKKIVIAGNKDTAEPTKESDSDSDSDSESGENETTLVPEQIPEREELKEKENETKKLTKQFKNKTRSDKIVAEIGISQNRNVKAARTTNDEDTSWIDDI